MILRIVFTIEAVYQLAGSVARLQQSLVRASSYCARSQGGDKPAPLPCYVRSVKPYRVGARACPRPGQLLYKSLWIFFHAQRLFIKSTCFCIEESALSVFLSFGRTGIAMNQGPDIFKE